MVKDVHRIIKPALFKTDWAETFDRPRLLHSTLSDIRPVAGQWSLGSGVKRSRDRGVVGCISTSEASNCLLARISFCIQLRTFIPVESSSAWH